MKILKNKGFVIGFLVGAAIGRELLMVTLDIANIAFGRRKVES